MTKINLLPWREARRELRKRRFLGLWGGVGVWTLLVVLIVHMVMSDRISAQRTYNRVLSDEIAQLDKQIEEIKNLKKVRADLIARMQIIQDLQADRPHVVKMYDQLVRILPKGIYYHEITREGNNLLIDGYAESNTNISDLMRTIETSKLFELPKLKEIKEVTVAKRSVSQFKLAFQLINIATTVGKEPATPETPGKPAEKPKDKPNAGN